MDNFHLQAEAVQLQLQLLPSFLPFAHQQQPYLPANNPSPFQPIPPPHQSRPRHRHRQHVQHVQQEDSLKHRAKSTPNLLAEVLPPSQWVTDGHNGVTYRVGQLLGQGGFAKCFLATSNGQMFALKVISRESIRRQAKQLGKIQREVQIHFRLRHPNIVALYSTFECPQRNIYMLLELCPNRTLAEYIDQSPARCLPESSAIVFMKQLLLAVHYLHVDCGLLHRDIKPGNVLLSREWTVKLADFGFCCPVEELAKLQTHSVCGTPNYVAPEVIDQLGHRPSSDCWSLGCTLHTILFGRPPFHSDTIERTYARIRACQFQMPPRREQQLGVSQSAQDFIRKTLVLHPEQRLTVVAMLAHSAMNPRPSFERSLSQGSGTGIYHFEDFGRDLKLAIDSGIGGSAGSVAAVAAATSAAVDEPPPAMDTRQRQPPLLDCSLPSLGRHNLLEQYIRALHSLMDPFDALALVPMPSASPPPPAMDMAFAAVDDGEEGLAEQMPGSFVAKWVDYTNKFGFGVTLRDGTRSILFNDHSSLSTTPNQRHFSFHPSQQAGGTCLEWSHSGGGGHPTRDIRDKVAYLKILREYMDRELYSSLAIGQQEPDLASFQPGKGLQAVDHSRHGIDGTFASSRLVHILGFAKQPDALFLLLSDGTCQVNFFNSRYKLAMRAEPGQAGKWPEEFQLHLATANRGNFHFHSAKVHPQQQLQAVPPLSDRDWALLRAFQRVLQQAYADERREREGRKEEEESRQIVARLVAKSTYC